MAARLGCRWLLAAIMLVCAAVARPGSSASASGASCKHRPLSPRGSVLPCPPGGVSCPSWARGDPGRGAVAALPPLRGGGSSSSGSESESESMHMQSEEGEGGVDTVPGEESGSDGVVIDAEALESEELYPEFANMTLDEFEAAVNARKQAQEDALSLIHI